MNSTKKITLMLKLLKWVLNNLIFSFFVDSYPEKYFFKETIVKKYYLYKQ